MGVANPANFWKLRPFSQAQFRMQHHLAHRTYEQALTVQQGIALASQDLTAPVSPDWLMRHDSRHRALTAIMGRLGAAPAVSSNTADLASLDPEDAQAVKAWMHYHALLHAVLDAFFGVRT